jgi:hypothetical protein
MKILLLCKMGSHIKEAVMSGLQDPISYDKKMGVFILVKRNEQKAVDL